MTTKWQSSLIFRGEGERENQGISRAKVSITQRLAAHNLRGTKTEEKLG